MLKELQTAQNTETRKLFFLLMEEIQSKENKIKMLEEQVRQQETVIKSVSSLIMDLFLRNGPCSKNEALRLVQEWAVRLPQGSQWHPVVMRLLKAIFDREEAVA